MNDERKVFLVLVAFFLFVIAFIVNSFLTGNLEFVFYSTIILVVLFFVVKYRHKFNMSTGAIVAILVFLVLHILGGNVYIGGVRLYDYWIISSWLKYDNFLHFVGGFLASIISYNLIMPTISERKFKDKIFIGLTVVLVASGLGAFNELIELVAVVFFNAAERVGDYMNNAIDLLFNFIGSVFSLIYVFIYIHVKDETKDEKDLSQIKSEKVKNK